MTIEEFLLARIGEDEAVARMWYQDEGGGEWEPLEGRVLAECAAKRQIVEMHQSWPVMVEAPPTLEYDRGGISSLTMRMTRHVAWLTQQEYRSRFGTEPPTTPMLRAIAAVYADHPDYQQDWTV